MHGGGLSIMGAKDFDAVIIAGTPSEGSKQYGFGALVGLTQPSNINWF